MSENRLGCHRRARTRPALAALSQKAGISDVPARTPAATTPHAATIARRAGIAGRGIPPRCLRGARLAGPSEAFLDPPFDPVAHSWRDRAFCLPVLASRRQHYQ